MITITDDIDIESCDPDYNVHSGCNENKNNFYMCRVFTKKTKSFPKNSKRGSFSFRLCFINKRCCRLRSWNISVFSSPQEVSFSSFFLSVLFLLFFLLFSADLRWRLAACPVLGHTVWFWNVMHISKFLTCSAEHTAAEFLKSKSDNKNWNLSR